MQQVDHNTDCQIGVRVRVSVILNRPGDNKLCFVRHFKNNQRYWLLPGGGQKVFETAKDAAARELYEELRVTAQDFRLAFVRETMNKKENRHIQFLVFEAVNPNFNNLCCTGEDARVEGVDFFDESEIKRNKIYPDMKQDILDYHSWQLTELFKTLDWVP